MALLKCPACDSSVSSAAASCPHCGHPFSRPRPPQLGPGSARRIAGSVVLVCLVGLGLSIYYHSLSQDDRDQVNRMAAATGVPVVPWINRAETAARKMFAAERSGAVVARSILNIAHPTGNSPFMREMKTEREGDTLVVRFVVDWTGGFLGSSNTTIVRWKCTKTQNLGIEIEQDTGIVGIASSNLNQLANYFQTEVYSVLLSNAG